jgi:hypothetical protein
MIFLGGPWRCIIIMAMIFAAGGTFLVENPANSLIALHPRWVWFLECLRKYHVFVPRRSKHCVFFRSKTGHGTCLWWKHVLNKSLISYCFHSILGLSQGMEGSVLDEEIWRFVMETHMVMVKQSQYRGPGQGPFDTSRAKHCQTDYYKISRQIGQTKIQRKWKP